MNLSDFVEYPDQILQDEWTKQAPSYGEKGQISVLGLDGKRSGGNKTYLVRCSICASDPEMFGEGVFRTRKSSLLSGSIPCACAKKAYRWSTHQWLLRLQRKVSILGFDIISVAEPESVSHRTKIILSCSNHGKWITDMNCFLNSGSTCHKCADENSRDNNRKLDEEMIASFFASGAFHPDTKFWRSDRKINGLRRYWKFLCPICTVEAESQATSLQQGFRGCGCGRSKQTQAYINLLIKNKGIYAAKFGIACNTGVRVSQQNNASPLDVIGCMIYDFPDYRSCRDAETACKRSLDCRFVEKELLPDGYTETVCIRDINKITEIYESFGGVLRSEICT